MRQVLILLVISFVSVAGQAQSITVRNFLNPDAPAAREALTSIEGENLTNEQLVNLFDPMPTTLGGVTVKVGGVLQRIFSVSPTRVVFLMDSSGPALRLLELKTKSNATYQAEVAVATVWPGVFVKSTGDAADSYIVSGRWTIEGTSFDALTAEPVPVGPESRPTFVIIQGSGWRLAGPAGVSVRLNGIPCKVIASRASTFPTSQDELLFQIPAYLAGSGVMDLIVSVNGRQSNFARINIGSLVTAR